jgi:RNA polymerase II subunit A small phosphatase-like protein
MKKLLILDLDETLIHTEVIPDHMSDQFDWDFKMESSNGSSYYTKKRPYLDQFLKFAFENFDIAVWTAASKDYAENILKNIGIDESNLKFLYTKENCTLRADNRNGSYTGQYYGIKNLNKLKRKGYDLDQVLIVDDVLETAENNWGNLIRIKPYTYEREDTELLKLISYLEYIKNVNNVRSIEKRGWSNGKG